MRPLTLVAVIGTGTEVGKTFVGAQIISELRSSGFTVAVRKPLQSNYEGEQTDAEVLAEASGENPTDVCKPNRSFDMPLAPPMAASELGLEVPTTAILVGEVADSWPDPAVEFGFIEPAGGIRSPYCSDGDSIDFMAKSAPDAIVLVADAELGTINSTVMTESESSRAFGDSAGGEADLPPIFVYLNRFDSEVLLHRLNRDHLSEVAGFEVFVDHRTLAAHLGELARH